MAGEKNEIESRTKFNRLLRKTKIVDNPLVIWVSLAWCASKVWQWKVQSDATVWERGWNWFLDIVEYFVGDDAEFYIIVHGTGTLSLAVIVVVSTIFLFMDIFLRPESLRKYKVQLSTNEPPDWRKLRKVTN